MLWKHTAKRPKPVSRRSEEVAVYTETEQGTRQGGGVQTRAAASGEAQNREEPRVTEGGRRKPQEAEEKWERLSLLAKDPGGLDPTWKSHRVCSCPGTSRFACLGEASECCRERDWEAGTGGRERGSSSSRPVPVVSPGQRDGEGAFGGRDRAPRGLPRLEAGQVWVRQLGKREESEAMTSEPLFRITNAVQKYS